MTNQSIILNILIINIRLIVEFEIYDELFHFNLELSLLMETYFYKCYRQFAMV